MANLLAAGRLVKIIDCPGFVKLAKDFPEAELSATTDAPPVRLATSASMICFFPV